MKYSFSCPLCRESVTVEAPTDAEAVEMILTQGRQHAKEAHPKFPVPDAMLKSMIQTGMKKEG